ncbi:g5435 [Coccomyxa viridis]|uniref:G5435 protein n=1 Tax=Coccomyxa viridis TaxID=1274662 RepID=A0ABP1FSU9_9CHLO
MTGLSPPLHSYLGLGTLIDNSPEEWLADDYESEEAWLTPSKAAGLLPPLAEQQDTVSRRVSSEQLQSPSECCDSSQKTPSPSTPHQEHEATHVQHLQYSSGVASQEEEHSETALNGNSGFEEQRSGISISSSPSSPLIANSISHRPGSTVSQAELYPSPLEAIGLSSNADHSQWKSHSLQTGDAAPWPMNKPAHASGSSSGISSGSEDAESLGLDPYTARHLCLQELELLWSEECSDGDNKDSCNDDSAEKHARDLLRSLQIASLLGKLRSAVQKVDEQLAMTMAQMQESSHAKVIWVQTESKDVLTAALEAGLSTMVFDTKSADLAEQWSQIGRFQAMNISEDGAILSSSAKVGELKHISSGKELRQLQSQTFSCENLVVDMSDWRIIPAENMVAAFQNQNARLLPVARSAEDAKVMLEALEAGTDGVVLHTQEPAQVRELATWVQQRQSSRTRQSIFDIAEVVRIESVGMGDRVCVDMASLLVPGEGLLVGSFARALFLVHSECAESAYINSRPFRVNAGPVHAYLAAPGGKTAYLSELKSGSEVLVVDPHGRQRTAVVGRIKVEQRPLVLVEAKTSDDVVHSLLLQNAETVRLVGPASTSLPSEQAAGNGNEGEGQVSWRAVSVSEMQVGDRVFLRQQGAARHTGISINESILER